MKIVELIINELDKLSGFDAVALVEEPAIEANFLAFKSEDLEDIITLQLIKTALKEQFVDRLPGESREDYMERCVPVLRSEGHDQDQAVAICIDGFKFDETQDAGEIEIYGYQTRHYDMCPGATSLYEAIIRGDHGDIDKDLVLRAAKLQDSLFYLEKHVLDMGSATIEDIHSAENLADEIYTLADMMGLRAQHSYIDSHVEKIKEVANEQFQSYTDYPESATNAAKRALEWRDSHPDQGCGTRVGWARANQLANKRPISEETIARMASFARHLQHEDVPYSEGCGGLMVDAWGGRAGIEWAQRKLEDIREENSRENFGITGKDTKYNFALNVDEQIVVGPLMIPDKLILRIDEEGEPYYVFFSKETIQKIAGKMMKNKLLDKMNVEHNPDRPVDGYMMETWIVSDPLKDKSNTYGFEVPEGTWMGMYKVENEDVWDLVKDQQLKGFSIEGWFGNKLVQAKKNNI